MLLFLWIFDATTRFEPFSFSSKQSFYLVDQFTVYNVIKILELLGCFLEQDYFIIIFFCKVKSLVLVEKISSLSDFTAIA